MSNKSKTNTKRVRTEGLLTLVREVNGFYEYTLEKNGLTVLFKSVPDTGIITTNIVYKIGSRDESTGETGVAHMLEHMVFKRTKADYKHKHEKSASMLFEEETGSVLNANTWKDRTCYYFSYPKKYFSRVLKIEAERMQGVVFTDEEFQPERGSVLSEFDMNANDEEFTLSCALSGTALHAHPYRHETIGFREDIEEYTVTMLERYYKTYYTPDNATLIVLGDLDEATMMREVVKYMSSLKRSSVPHVRPVAREPKQEGKRLVVVERPSQTNILGLALRHEGFPTAAWFETLALLEMLGAGEDSVLYRTLVDTGLVTRIHISLEPTRDENVAMLFFTLAKPGTHDQVYKKILEIVGQLTQESIRPYLTKTIAHALRNEYETRDNTLGLAQSLVEYISADAWPVFFETEALLKAIRPKDIEARLKHMFTERYLTIGHFIGTLSVTES